ncbi:prepilin peptidase [Patescibacteria group bacterium]|nr:prepilin peptidase [Patescibacteria group bacterium]
MLFFILIAGLVVGSFLSAYTYRAPRGKSVKKGRSYCDACKNPIAWYDNIPLFSFIILKGKCRDCNQKISWRYPAIEISTALIFVAITYALANCAIGPRSSDLCIFYGILGAWAMPFLLLVATVLIAIFIIDLEHKIIPDEAVLALFAITVVVFILADTNTLFIRLLAGFLASLFLLLIHIVTRGRGMGLGDVKLALFGGIILDWPQTATWLFVSFVLGSIVGLVLIALKKAAFGKQIPFGPFLVVSLGIILFWGNTITDWLFSGLL